MQKSTVFLDTKNEISEKEKLIHDSIKSNEIDLTKKVKICKLKITRV